MTAYNKKLSSRDFSTKKNACVSRAEMNNLDAASVATGCIKCFSCRKLGHRQVNTFRLTKIKKNILAAGDVKSVTLLCSGKKIARCVVALVHIKRLPRLDVLCRSECLTQLTHLLPAIIVVNVLLVPIYFLYEYARSWQRMC